MILIFFLVCVKGDDVELALFVVVKEGDVRDILCYNCRLCIYACAYMVCVNHFRINEHAFNRNR